MKRLNCCIVCYKNVDHSPSYRVNENEECVTARFVQLFQRHVNNFSLESTQITVRDSALTFLPGNGIDGEPIQFQTCVSCSEVLSSFNSSYGDLKCAEMKANWRLHQLANVIRFADYAPARRTKFRESVNDLDLEGDQMLIYDIIEIISNFRKQLQNQCRLQHKNQFPRVVLMRPPLRTGSREENVIKNKQKQNESIAPSAAAKSNDATLILTALKNLSSLQLIIYLALFDSVFKNQMSISNTNLEADERLEDENSFGFRKESTLQPFTDVEVSPSPSLPPSPINSSLHENEWKPGEGRECSKSVDLEPPIVHNPKPNSSRSFLKPNYATKNQFYCINCGCGQRFETKDCLRDHERQCQSKFDGLTFTKQRQIVVHLRDADGIVNEQANDKYGSSEQNLTNSDSDLPTTKFKEYRIKIIKRVTTHSCMVCQLELDSVNALQQHMETCSKRPNGPELAATNASSSDNIQIKQEPIEIPYKNKMRRDKTQGSLNKNRCDQCKKRYKTAARLRTHKLTHLGPEPMKLSCSICGKNFKWKDVLSRHMEIHTGENPYKCSEDDCKFSFRRPKSLRYHLQKCHGAEGWKQSCRYCGKTFIRKDMMKRHLRTHTGEKPFKCSVDGCQKRFSRKDALKLHLKHCKSSSVATEGTMETQT